MHKLTDLGSVLPIASSKHITTSTIINQQTNSETLQLAIKEETNVTINELNDENNQIDIIINSIAKETPNEATERSDNRKSKFLRMISLPARAFEKKFDSISPENHQLNQLNDNIFINENIHGDLNNNQEVLLGDKNDIIDIINNGLKRSKSLEFNDNYENENSFTYKGNYKLA